MFTTLDQLQQHIHYNQSPRSRLGVIRREVKIVVVLCITVFVINSLVTNAQLYAEAVQSILQSTGMQIHGINNTEAPLLENNNNSLKETIIDQDYMHQKKAVDELTTSIAAMNIPQSDDFPSEKIIDSNLKQGLDTYTMQFNMLPPTSRIIIPRLSINAPLIQSSAQKAVADLTKEDFDKDLFHGVVQYPTTPEPGELGNTLLFGHTSYYSRKQNPYATIFSGLPKLENNDTIEVVSHGKIYSYKIIAKNIVSPNQVDKEYKKYTNGKYITLLGCYPIGSDTQRIVIVGELQE